MSVYKHAKTPFYQYDFVVDGRRFLGSTKTGSKKEALGFEAKVREQAKRDPEREADGQRPAHPRRRRWPLLERGRPVPRVRRRHLAGAQSPHSIFRQGRAVGGDQRRRRVGAGCLATKANPLGRVAYKDKKPMASVSPATVNRDTTAVLKKLCTRARRTWKYHLPSEPNWRDHWLREAEERLAAERAKRMNFSFHFIFSFSKYTLYKSIFAKLETCRICW